ncbi:MAG: hypothetical protein NVS9B1_17730 [Candidatus Dormibacteraceae bacterium]
MRTYVLRTAVLALGITVAGVACGSGGSQSSTPASTPTAAPTAAPSPTPNYPAGFTAFGYPTVTASTNFTPGQDATLTHGGITVQIPGGAYDKPLVFQLLEGQLDYWQKQAPAGTKVISAFAFRSVDQASNELVQKYNAPVIAVFTDPQVSDKSVYWNTTPSDPPKVIANPVPATIQGQVLKHGNIGSPVGWIITTPQP